MAAKTKDLSIQWPFAPNAVRLNSDTGLLKIIAMVTMLCDHAGKMLFPEYQIMRVIGRIAFPIYAYCIAAGCVYTRDPLKYLRRIVLLALISQPLYAVAMGHTVNSMYAVSFAEHPVEAALNFYIKSWNKPSILVSLTMGMLLIWMIRERQLVFAVGLFVACWLIQNKLDYGIKGIALMLLFYVFCNRILVSLPCVLAYMLWWGLKSSGYSLFGVEFGIQTFAVCALPFIYIRTDTRIKIPKWISYGFYPLHLVLIYVLDNFVMK